MAEIRVIDLTEMYRFFEGIKGQPERVAAAKEKILEHLLIVVEDLRITQTSMMDLAKVAVERRAQARAAMSGDSDDRVSDGDTGTGA